MSRADQLRGAEDVTRQEMFFVARQIRGGDEDDRPSGRDVSAHGLEEGDGVRDELGDAVQKGSVVRPLDRTGARKIAIDDHRGHVERSILLQACTG